MRPQMQEKDLSIRLKVANKKSNMVFRGYITEGVILALAYFFYMPKETEDICIVCDTNVSGINDSLWDPKCMLPSMRSLLMMVVPEMYMVNLDDGEMF